MAYKEGDITSDGFSIESIKIASNSKDWRKSAKVLTSFDNFIKHVDISACFSFCQMLRRLFEYYSIELWYF